MTDLGGKDYFTEKEAAHYCCVSLSQFRAKIRDSGLRPGKLWGKNVYRRSDLQKIIEDTAWRPFKNAGTNESPAGSQRPTRLIGAREAGSAAGA